MSEKRPTSHVTLPPKVAMNDSERTTFFVGFLKPSLPYSQKDRKASPPSTCSQCDSEGSCTQPSAQVAVAPAWLFLLINGQSTLLHSEQPFQMRLLPRLDRRTLLPSRWATPPCTREGSRCPLEEQSSPPTPVCASCITHESGGARRREKGGDETAVGKDASHYCRGTKKGLQQPAKGFLCRFRSGSRDRQHTNLISTR